MVERGDITQRVEGSEIVVISGTGSATINIYNYYYHEEIRSTPVESEPATAEPTLPCPYRGLFHFSPKDAKFFFGRENFVEELVQATQNRNFIAVLGASGSGKSSVVFAGLVPRLQQANDWQFTHFRPGSDPFQALALALVPLYQSELNSTDEIIQALQLARSLSQDGLLLSVVFTKIQQKHPDKRVLLIADQFEELYTLCRDESLRRQFLYCLLEGIQSPNLPIVLVTTMRATILGSALSYPPFVDVLQNAQILLGAMNEFQLSLVIERPSEKLGVMFEAGLVRRILNDVKNEPGNLPLLEFALTLLWEKRRENLLTHEAYDGIGEIKGALVNYADSKYAALTDLEKQQARRIFLQLIRLGEETEDSPQVATKEQLGAENWDLIRKLADARLVVTNCRDTGREIVELIHEALIQHWQQLRQWLDESRESLLEKKKIEIAAKEWQNNGKKPDPDYLFQGRRLKKAKYFQEEQGQEFPLSPIAREFIQTGVRQQRNKKIQVGGSLLIIPVVGIGLWSLVSIWQYRTQAKLLENRLSLGEKIFFNSHVDKRSGADFFAQKNFKKAAEKFRESLKIIPDDPEALIYLNNAIVANKNPLTIAVSVPIGKVQNVAQEILRGVAQAQNEVNKNGGINGKLLQVEIGNDDNDPESAKDIAVQLVGDSEILAVVGHNASNVSKKGAEVYQDHLVMISPTSFQLDFQEIKKPQAENYIFRTVYGYKVLLPNLADHIKKTLKNPNLLICYDSQAYDQQWLTYGFSQVKEIKLLKIPCDFSNSNLDLEQVIQQGINEKANSLFLSPHVNRINEGINLVKTNKGRLKLFGSATLYTIDTLKLGQKDVEGLVLSVYWHPSVFPRNPFYEDAKKLWGEDVGVTWRTPMAYDATKVIIEGLKKIPASENPTRERLQQIISDPKFKIEGATGKVQFLPSGERQAGQAFLVEVCSGKESGTGYDFVPLGTCLRK